MAVLKNKCLPYELKEEEDVGLPQSMCSAILLQYRKKCVAVMADYSSVAPPSSNAGAGMNDAFKDALQRARQVIFQVITFVLRYLF